MSSEIIFLCGVPDSTPGLLFKMFLEVPDTLVFFKPFTPMLDLIVRYSTVWDRDIQVPYGYFDSYSSNHSILKRYPSHLEEPSFEALESFLEDCVRSSKLWTVFDISGTEAQLPVLLKKWPQAKTVSYQYSCTSIPVEQVLQVSKESLTRNYAEETLRIRKFCHIKSATDIPVFLNSDWLKLCQQPVQPELLTFSKVSRAFLTRFVEQKAAINELAKQEVEIRSLKDQLRIINQAAEERLKLIDSLTAAPPREHNPIAQGGSVSFVEKVKRLFSV